MGAGGQSASAPARAVVASYYADLAAGRYTAACRLLRSAYVRLAGQALLAIKHDKGDAEAAIHRPSAANCGRVIADVVRLEKVDIGRSSGVRITGARVRGKVVTVSLDGVPGAGGSTTQLAAIVTDVHGAWIITGFASA